MTAWASLSAGAESVLMQDTKTVRPQGFRHRSWSLAYRYVGYRLISWFPLYLVAWLTGP